MKTTRMRIGLIAALLAIALAAYWMFLRPPEDPLCKGVPLSVWMERPEWDSGKPPIRPEDLRAIAPKAAPFLAYYLRAKCPQTQYGLGTRMPDRLQRKLPLSWTMPKVVGSGEKWRHALTALGWLGADAEPALPTLVTLLNSHNGIENAAAQAIHRIGPASWPAVLKIWHSGSLEARRVIIWGLPSRFEYSPVPAATEAEKKSAIDLLLEACRDPEYHTQFDAIDALARCRGCVGASPLFDPAVPVLIRFTEEVEAGKGMLPEAAARVLAEFPEHARTIIPALEKLAGSSNPECREAAKKAAKLALESIEKQKPKGE